MLKLIRQWKKPGFAMTLGMVALCFTGCRAVNFYRQAIVGQIDILARQTPVEKLLAEPNLDPALRRQLDLLEELRVFAKEQLHLKVDGHYRKYADLNRSYVVWNVEVAHEFSLEPKTWWYPVVGRLKYRGYFSREAARQYAHYLRGQSLDVYTGGVQAYSTLGWSKDPALNTFLFLPDTELAELIFHELGHQTLFAPGDTDFNEAFATTVGQRGVCRWLEARRDQPTLHAYELELRRNASVVRLVLNARNQLEGLYGDIRDSKGKLKASTGPRPFRLAALRQEKRRVQDQLGADYQRLVAQWPGYRNYQGFFADDLNNAKLNSIANYYDLVPGFERLLQMQTNNLSAFYLAAGRLAKKNKAERYEWLRTPGLPHNEQ